MIAAVVCVDSNYGIGNQNNLLANIPEDMKMFKKITTGGAVVVGRKTYDSLPKKPLPNRENIIITYQADDKPKMQKDGTIYSNMKYIKAWLSKEEVINQNNGIYIIGGGMIYKELLPFCERVYITKVFHAYENVDTFFPNIDEMPEWEMTSASEIKEHDGIKYQFCVYDRSDYKIHHIFTHNNNSEVEKGDFVIDAEVFNGHKTVVITKDKQVYIDDWEYLKNTDCLNRFLEKVSEVQNAYKNCSYFATHLCDRIEVGCCNGNCDACTQHYV
jgi:dihydrofolate reductase